MGRGTLGRLRRASNRGATARESVGSRPSHWHDHQHARTDLRPCHRHRPRRTRWSIDASSHPILSNWTCVDRIEIMAKDPHASMDAELIEVARGDVVENGTLLFTTAGLLGVLSLVALMTLERRRNARGVPELPPMSHPSGCSDSIPCGTGASQRSDHVGPSGPSVTWIPMAFKRSLMRSASSQSWHLGHVLDLGARTRPPPPIGALQIGSSQFIKRWQDAEHRACMITEPLEEMMGDSSLVPSFNSRSSNRAPNFTAVQEPEPPRHC